MARSGRLPYCSATQSRDSTELKTTSTSHAGLSDRQNLKQGIRTCALSEEDKITQLFARAPDLCCQRDLKKSQRQSMLQQRRCRSRGFQKFAHLRPLPVGSCWGLFPTFKSFLGMAPPTSDLAHTDSLHSQDFTQGSSSKSAAVFKPL